MADPRHEETRELISSFIGKNSSVLDIGCGTGALARHLAPRCKQVAGLDLSSRMIEEANYPFIPYSLITCPPKLSSLKLVWLEADLVII